MARLSLVECTATSARFDDNSTTAFPTNLKRSTLSFFLKNFFQPHGIGDNTSTIVRHAVDASIASALSDCFQGTCPKLCEAW